MSSLQSRSPFVRITSYVLFFLLILAFGLWGIGDIFMGSGRVTTVATVGDQEISSEAFQESLRTESQALQRNAGGRLTRDQLLALNVADRAMAPLIERALFDQLASDMGLVVSDDQVLAQIAREPSFRNAQGQFDQQRYMAALQRAGMGEAQFFNALRADILRNYLLTTAVEAVAMPQFAADRLFVWLDERRIAQYLPVKADSITELPEPTPEALRQVYEDYEADFQAPEYRSVTLLHLTAEDFLGDVMVGDADIAAWYEANKESYSTPERRAVSQIVYAGRAEAEAALAELQGGATLAQVAEAEGLAPIPLPLQSQADLAGLLPPLAEAVFALPPDERFGIADSPLGFHLFEVTQLEAGHRPTLEEIRDELADDLTMSRAVDILVSVAGQVEAELNTGATLEETAGRLNLELARIEAVDRAGLDRAGRVVEGLPSPQQVVGQIFADEPGLETPLTEADDGSYYAFRVEEVIAPATRPYDEVEDRVRDLWANLERKRLAHEQAQALVDRVEAGETFDWVTALSGIRPLTTEPMNRFETSPEMTPSAALPPLLFAAEPGKPFVVDAEDGSLVVVLRLVLPADPARAPERVEMLSQSLDRSLRSDLVQEFLASLQRDYPVTVNQQALDQLLLQIY